MLSTNVKKGVAILFGMALLSFSVTGCGGGSSDTIATDTAQVGTELVVITEENSEQVLSSAFEALGGGFDFQDGPSFIGIASAQNNSIVKSTQTSALKEVFSSARDLKTLAESASIECSEGGSISYSGTETSGTATYNNCQEYGTTINGTMSVTINANYTSGSMTFTNFSITDQDGSTLVWDSVDYTFSDTTMSVSMSGYSIYGGERVEFDNYEFALTFDSSDNMSLTVSGMIKTDCLGAWIEIRTTEAIQFNTFDSCPSAGQIVIEGGSSSLTVNFNADGSIDVSGSVSAHYDNCTALDADVCTL